jgi:hypothetical protein
MTGTQLVEASMALRPRTSPSVTTSTVGPSEQAVVGPSEQAAMRVRSLQSCHDILPLSLTDRRMRFCSLMQHINCAGAFGLSEYEDVYGTISSEHPWGCHFWAGFRGEFEQYMVRYSHRLACVNFQEGIFRKPVPFAKSTARNPCQLSTLDGSAYPCFFGRTADADYIYMICIHIVIKGCRPWVVHASWITSSL